MESQRVSSGETALVEGKAIQLVPIETWSQIAESLNYLDRTSLASVSRKLNCVAGGCPENVTEKVLTFYHKRAKACDIATDA